MNAQENYFHYSQSLSDRDSASHIVRSSAGGEGGAAYPDLPSDLPIRGYTGPAGRQQSETFQPVRPIYLPGDGDRASRVSRRGGRGRRGRVRGEERGKIQKTQKAKEIIRRYPNILGLGVICAAGIGIVELILSLT